MARWKTKRVGEHPDIILALEHNLTFATDAEVNARIERKYRLYDWLTNSDYANQMMLQTVIDEWSDYCNQLYETTQYEYDPILNYDKHEEGTETTARHKGTKRSTNISLKDSTNVDRKSSTNTNVTETETPRVAQVTDTTGYGLNSTTGAPVQKVTENAPTGTNTNATTGDAANNYTRDVAIANDNYTERTGNASNNYETTTDIDANTYDKDVLSFTDRRTYGNIGVMTTQEMIQRERDIIIEVLDVYVSKFAECFDISTDVLIGWLCNHDDDGNEEPDYEEEP